MSVDNPGPSPISPGVPVAGVPATPVVPVAAEPRHVQHANPPSANRIVAGIFGSLLLLIGAFGFTATGSNFIGAEGALFLGIFEVNGLENLIHIVTGLVLLLASRNLATLAARTNIGVGAFYLIFGIVGPLIQGEANVFAFNAADQVFYIFTAVVLIGSGVFFDRNLDSREVPI